MSQEERTILDGIIEMRKAWGNVQDAIVSLYQTYAKYGKCDVLMESISGTDGGSPSDILFCEDLEDIKDVVENLCKKECAFIDYLNELHNNGKEEEEEEEEKCSTENEVNWIESVLHSLVQKYDLKPFGQSTNKTFTGQKDASEIKVEGSSGLDGMIVLSVKVAFGEVRHTPSRSRNTYGERGMVFAILCHKQEGLMWRISGVAPKGRTTMINDKYIQVDDIIAHLLTLEDQVSKGQTHSQDLTYGCWDEAEHGW